MRARIPLIAVACAIALLAVAPIAAAAHLPGVLWHDGGRASAFLVRPSSIYTTEDGSGVEGVLRRGGAEVERGPGRGSLHWRRWTSRSAYGVGTQWIKLATPTATSPFTREPLQVTLYRVRAHRFTRMLLRSIQRGHVERVTECLSAPFHGSYTWGTIYGGRCS